MNWRFLSNINGVNLSLDGDSKNFIGTPLVSASRLSVGDAGYTCVNAGGYLFQVHGSPPATVSVSGLELTDTDNPFFYAGNTAAVFDSVTPNFTLLPGWSIVLSASAQDGDQFLVTVGCAGSDVPPYRVLSQGDLIAGIGSSGVSAVTVKNYSTGTMTGCQAVATNAARIKNGVSFSRPFYAFWQAGLTNPAADPNLSGAAVSFANVNAGKADIFIGGNPIDVTNVATAILIPGGVGLFCDGSTVYQFSDQTKYQSVRFILSSALQGTDTATIYVSPGGEGVEFSLDGNLFVPGTVGLLLGNLSSQDMANFFITINPQASLSSAMNQLSYSLRIVGTNDASAIIDAEVIGSYFLSESSGPLVLRVTALKSSYGSYPGIADILSGNGVTFV